MSAETGRAAQRDTALEHIAIDLRFDWPRRHALGMARLHLRVRRATQRVTLDAGRLQIEGVARRGGPALTWACDGGEQDDGLVVNLDRVFAAQELLTLEVHYRSGWVNQSDPNSLWGSTGKGLRFFEPTAADARKRRQLWPSNEPGAARFWFPGYDAPDHLRTAELTLTVQPPLQAVAGGTLAGVQPNADGSRSYHWQLQRPHASHRTLFVVGEFTDVPQPHGDTALHNLGYPDEVAGVQASVARLSDTQAFLAGWLGTPLPHPAYSQVFAQDLPWNLVGSGIALQTENMVDDAGTHHDFLYLWNGLQTESLAQQWLGAHLSPAHWGHAWLDRALAHHLAALYTEHKNGREEMLLWYLQADQATALGDWQAGVRESVVNEAATDWQAFVSGNTPYARGAAVLHMLRMELGDTRWRQALQQYMHGSAPRLVRTADLQRAVNAAAGRDMDWFFAQWVFGSGHPVFEVECSHNAAAGRIEMNVRQAQAEPRWFQGHVDIDIDGRVQRVWLAPQALNRFAWPASEAPRLVHFDHQGGWLKELRFSKPAPELLHQLQHTDDAAGRQWASTQLAARIQQEGSAPRLKQEVLAALGQVAASPRYWRERFNALQQMRALLAPTGTQPVALHDTLRQTLLQLVKNEASWLRAAAISVLGLSRDAGLAPLYMSLLRDSSDRVINSAAIALGRSQAPAAFGALAALPPHPSWKNQSLISALAGLKELGDARGVPIALAALGDVHAARWTLSTPIWDYRIAAAETLRTLGAGASGFDVQLPLFQQALAGDDINDLFSQLLLLVRLGDKRAQPLFAPLKQRFAADAEALKALEALQAELTAAV